MQILDRLLKKIGIEDYSKLSEEERATFNLWAKELEGKEVTIPELKNFLEGQMKLNLNQFEDFDNPKVKDLFIKVYSRICRQILSFIDTPERLRKGREAMLNEKLNEKPNAKL